MSAETPSTVLEAHANHYAWNSDTAARKEELEKLGVVQGPTEIAGAKPSEVTAAAASGSAWNGAGTWEDRDISGKAITELKTRLKALSHSVEVAGHGPAVLKLVKVPTCTGTVTVVFSRGKVRPGYDLKLTTTWQLESSSDGAVIGKGKLTCDELEDVDIGEHELLVSCGSGGALSDASKRAVQGSASAINAVISEWFEALKAM